MNKRSLIFLTFQFLKILCKKLELLALVVSVIVAADQLSRPWPTRLSDAAWPILSVLTAIFIAVDFFSDHAWFRRRNPAPDGPSSPK